VFNKTYRQFNLLLIIHYNQHSKAATKHGNTETHNELRYKLTNSATRYDQIKQSYVYIEDNTSHPQAKNEVVK